MVETPNMIADRIRTTLKASVAGASDALHGLRHETAGSHGVSKLKLKALTEGAAIVRKEIKA